MGLNGLSDQKSQRGQSGLRGQRSVKAMSFCHRMWRSLFHCSRMGIPPNICLNKGHHRILVVKSWSEPQVTLR
jgi:hypothetical protein